ncbi:hypothetical protein BKA59DRAFT_312023 [Fusarium tricinctum]|uniref:Zn(2)-C6 fungal-type domain-containing protein n=1 Tax=Fusarium tricinctum TaxID=61284 RepID=A0A8K0RRW2_9HYPO|nr:hypothetical protein BKA59DRAFT_312023 [Fusarium tricinctum]
MTINQTLVIRDKFKRASTPKVRTGCITCKLRHLKCDEAKPTCQRCGKDKVKCDGYAPPKPKGRRRSKKKAPSRQVESVVSPSPLSMQTIDENYALTGSEKLYLQHFLHWTTKQLSASSAATNFWLQYALPMSYHNDAIRRSMIAVGASHRAYIAHSLSYSRPHHLQRPVIQHYNRAIASILPIMSAPSDLNIHCTLICCLLFMACEGLSGRYDERLRHLTAGDMILQSLDASSFNADSALIEKVVDMFCQIGLECTGYLDDHPLSGIKKWCRKRNKELKFQNIEEASSALHQLRLNHEFAPWDLREDDAIARDDTFEDLLNQWNAAFEALCQQKPDPSEEEMSQINSLRLRYEYLKMYINAYDNKELGPSEPYKRFLETAEQVAGPLVSLNQPTFSLDGCLVSGLSFVAISNEEGDVKSQALDLLQKLDHREGIIDSNDIVEMHEMLGFDLGEWDSGSDSDSEVEEPDAPSLAPVGIPQMLESLSRRSGKPSKRLEGLYFQTDL